MCISMKRHRTPDGYTEDSLTFRIPVNVTDAEQAAYIEAVEELMLTDFAVESSRGGERARMTMEFQGLLTERPGGGPPVTTEDEMVEPDEEHPVYEVHERIQHEIAEKRHTFGGDIYRLVLGKPQVEALETWLDYAPTAPESIATLYGLREVITVPGPMIHPVVPREVWMDDG